MSVEFSELNPGDHDTLVDFLCANEWPFHARRQLTSNDVAAMEFSTPDVATFWIASDAERVGLVRVLDLGDIGEGAPLLDVRIAGGHRRRGFGKLATRWVVDHLFDTHPTLHRIEANTRHDNVAMQRVLSDAGFTCEGRLREAWSGDGGPRFDTLIYGILRADWAAAARNPTN